MSFHRHRWNMAKLVGNSRIHKWKKKHKTNPSNSDKMRALAYIRSEELKANATYEELLLKNKLDQIGILHYFQKPFHSNTKCAIVDFCFPRGTRTMLFVEVDGNYHLTDRQKQKDYKRTVWLQEKTGAEIIRFTNEDVVKKLDWVIKQIQKKLTNR